MAGTINGIIGILFSGPIRNGPDLCAGAKIFLAFQAFSGDFTDITETNSLGKTCGGLAGNRWKEDLVTNYNRKRSRQDAIRQASTIALGKDLVTLSRDSTTWSANARLDLDV